MYFKHEAFSNILVINKFRMYALRSFAFWKSLLCPWGPIIVSPDVLNRPSNATRISTLETGSPNRVCYVWQYWNSYVIKP